jgi:regulator of RNase E activity RraA
MTDRLVLANQKIDLKETTIARLSKASAATISLIMLKRGIRACHISGAVPLVIEGCEFVAEAFTLRFIPMREDLSVPEVLGDPEYAQRKLIEEIGEGQALVIDARGVTDVGTIGGILGIRLTDRGVKAIVSDGAMRDVRDLREGTLPVYCTGPAAPASLHAHYSSDYQNPIACGNAAVIPGDLLKGDQDGVIVIPRAMANDVADAAFEQERLERFVRKLIEKEGRPALGTYPPNEATQLEYQEWLAAGEPE